MSATRSERRDKTTPHDPRCLALRSSTTRPGKIGFLHQGRGATNVIGLRESSPFVVRTRRRWICNHMIQTNALNPARSHLEAFEAARFQELPGAFHAPSAHGRRGHDHPRGDGRRPVAHRAPYASSAGPIRLPIFFLNMTTPKTITDELEMTNVQPLVLAGISAANTQTVQHLVSVARTTPRKLPCSCPTPTFRSAT